MPYYIAASQALRTGLPVAIRVNRMRAGSRALVERLEAAAARCSKMRTRTLGADSPLGAFWE